MTFAVLLVASVVTVVPFSGKNTGKDTASRRTHRPKLIIRTVNSLTAEPVALTPVPEPAPAPAPAQTLLAAPPPAAVAPAPAPVAVAEKPLFTDTRPPSPRANNGFQSSALILLALSSVACIVAVLLRRRRGAQLAPVDIEVIATRAFGPKHRVNVIEVDGRRMLISFGTDGVRLLCNLDRTEPVAASFERALSESLAPPEVALLPMEPSAEVAGIIRLKQARAQGA